MITTIKTVNNIDINVGGGMAKGLYNMSRDNDISLWFDSQFKDYLLTLTEEEVEKEFKNLIRK